MTTFAHTLKRLGSRLPDGWRHAAARWRWRLAGNGAQVAADARLDWRTRLGANVAVSAGASVFGSEVGRHTYFGENALVIHARVGSFCSVAPGVIIGGGTHPTRDWVSTSPRFYSRRQNPRLAAAGEAVPAFEENPLTTVGHDVWLGYGAMVLPGVTVGDGAIVAAGAVVSRDVAPYGIVAGVPARPVRSRFSEEQVAWLQRTRWWDWDEARLEALTPHFHHPDALRAAVEAVAAELPMTPAAAPTLLILTPTLGVSPFLDATVASVRALDVPRQTVLVCPAGKMAEMRERYPDFDVVADAGREGGIYGALNAGLAAAKPGWDWFTYINDDDLLAPGFADLVRRHCRPENAGCVGYGDIGLLDGHSRPLGRMTIEKNPDHFGALLQDGISPVGQQGMVFSAPTVRALGGYRLAYRLCADLDFWARAHAAGTRFRHYGMTVGHFRIQPGQLSGDVALTRREQDEITRHCYPQPVSPLRRRLARWRYRLANAPRYVARWRAVGRLTSSDAMLGGDATLLAPDRAPSTSH